MQRHVAFLLQQQIFRLDVPINVTFAPAGDGADINRPFRAHVQASQALNATVLPLRLTVRTRYVRHGTNFFTQTALDALVRVAGKSFVQSFAVTFPVVVKFVTARLEQLKRLM